MPISNILSLTKPAVSAVDSLLERATEILRGEVTESGRISSEKLEIHQDATHALSWLATYAMALRQMHAWADRLNTDRKLGEMEQLILQIAFGEYLWQIYGGIPMSQGEIARLQDIGLSQDDQRALMIPRGHDALRQRQFHHRPRTAG